MTTDTIDLIRTGLHPGQRRVLTEAARFNVLDCGRRWGKSLFGGDLAIDPILDALPVGYFAPTYKLLGDNWRDAKQLLKPITKRVSETEHRVECITGGVLEMWTLDNPDAGRGRKYQRIIIDEAALVPKLEEAWTRSIRPTLTDLKGDAWLLSTPRGRDYFWQLYLRGQDEQEPTWASWQMPTAANPFIDADEIEAARKELPQRAFDQEYLALFLEDGGGVFHGVQTVVEAGRIGNDLFRRPGAEYSMGVDLARHEDFTVLSVLDAAGKQVFWQRLNHTEWAVQIDRIIDVAAVYSPALVIDATGAGDPVTERIKERSFERGVQLQFQPQDGFVFTNTSKTQIINGLAIAIEQHDISLMDVPQQTAELQAYRYELSQARHLSMNAPPGMHDDCVIALALAQYGRRMLTHSTPVGIVGLGAEQSAEYDEEAQWIEV